ncbi:MAG TPA: hypothetical protein VH857_01120 [Actinomycetes bacterium]|nr:hypothetical protein [Actinomycetes bacterium]
MPDRRRRVVHRWVLALLSLSLLSLLSLSRRWACGQVKGGLG